MEFSISDPKWNFSFKMEYSSEIYLLTYPVEQVGDGIGYINFKKHFLVRDSLQGPSKTLF